MPMNKKLPLLTYLNQKMVFLTALPKGGVIMKMARFPPLHTVSIVMIWGC